MAFHLVLPTCPAGRTFLSEIINEHASNIERYVLLYLEQRVRRDRFAFGDHSGKHGSRMRENGARLLNWTFTEMNSRGEIVTLCRVDTTSFNDASLVAAMDSRLLAEQRERAYDQAKGINPQKLLRVCVDNPMKDGPGVKANLWAGDGMRKLRFEGPVRRGAENEAPSTVAAMGKWRSSTSTPSGRHRHEEPEARTGNPHRSTSSAPWMPATPGVRN